MNKYTTSQLFWLAALRVIIGWHFLYEGLVKLANPNWTSMTYMMDSQGFMKGFFYFLASDPTLLSIVDFLNIWGLIAIGLGLILGLFTRVALISGIVLLAFYYLSHPPFIGLKYAIPSEGNYLIVNKILIEMVVLIVLLQFPAGRKTGLDRFIFSK